MKKFYSKEAELGTSNTISPTNLEEVYGNEDLICSTADGDIHGNVENFDYPTFLDSIPSMESFESFENPQEISELVKLYNEDEDAIEFETPFSDFLDSQRDSFYLVGEYAATLGQNIFIIEVEPSWCEEIMTFYFKDEANKTKDLDQRGFEALQKAQISA